MKDFFSAAIPFLLTGIALAILAVNCSGKREKRKNQGAHMATGAGFGLLLGVMLNSCGLWENHILGLILGVLWGMTLGSLYRETEAPDQDSED